MANKARIVDFEEARRSSRSRMSGSKARTASSSRRSAGPARTVATSAGRASAAGTRTSSSSRSGAGTRSGSSSGKKARKAQGAWSGKGTASRSTAAKRAEKRTKKPSDNANTRTPARAKKDGKATRAKRLDAIKRERTKKKASRLFTDNTGSETQAGSEPRAALYKAKMGSKHKKSAKMQDRERTSGFAWPSLGAKLARLNSKAGIALLTCICVVACCAFLYGPVKNYYTAVRDQARAEAAYEAVAARNDALKQDVALLVTDEGVEDRAREQYGWVKEGENAVVVAGLSDEAASPAAEVVSSVAVNEIQAPETWYSPLLDVVFGYEQ